MAQEILEESPGKQVVMRESEVEDPTPLHSAAMPATEDTSSQAANNIGILLEDDLLDPEQVSRQMDAIRRTEQYMKDVIKRSRQKSELLENLANSLVRAEELEKKLQEKTQQASRLQTKLDGTVAEYHNEIQRLTAVKDKVVDKNKALRREKQELKDNAERLQRAVDDWKCAFYQEQAKQETATQERDRAMKERDEAVEELKQLRRLNDENEALKKCLKELTAVAEPVADLFEARKAGVEPWPLVERLRDMPDKLIAYLHRLR